MDLDGLLSRVKDMIFKDPTTPHQPGHDPSGLIGQLEGLFSGFRNQQPAVPQSPYGNIRPASEDPLGDPADQEHAGQGSSRYAAMDPRYGPIHPAADPRFGSVRPASEDPLGDPADEEFRNIRPASEDPLGDSADEEVRRRFRMR